jgi:hypothetical protein
MHGMHCVQAYTIQYNYTVNPYVSVAEWNDMKTRRLHSGAMSVRLCIIIDYSVQHIPAHLLHM